VTRRQRIEDLTALAIPQQPALSPDGREIVYVLATADAAADRTVRTLWRLPRAGQARQLTRGTADACPAWSPDGTRVAFLRADDGPPQVWLLPMDGGEPEPLTTLPLGAGAPVWSPDGSKIAFSASADLRATPGEDEEARKRRAAGPIVADRLDYKADGAGLLGTVRQHLHVLDVETRECRQVTNGDWHAGSPAWSPDGSRVAFSAATASDADLDYGAPVYVIDVTVAGAVPRLAALADGVAGPVLWSADGAALLVVGTPGRSIGHLSLLRVPLDGGEIVNLAAVLDRNVMAGGPGYPGALPQLTDGGATVLFCVRDRGCSHLYAVPADGGGPPRPVLGGTGRVVSGMSAAEATAAVVLATPTSYGEIVTVDLISGAETVRTSHGQPGIELFIRAEREFAISDGTTVHGWVIRDPAATTPGPLLLDVHGGPHNAWNGAADPARLYHQELAARGWTVLLVNPRASDGYGEAFFTAAAGAWGVADAKDLLEPVDALVAEGIADPGRLAVAGYSYGGYMTCYLTSRDGRFAAAVAGGAVSDPTSVAGTSDVGHALAQEEWGAADRSEMSPLAHADAVRTPTLLLHGEADLRCPVGQAEQWHTALREQGVPVRLVRYPGASHLFILDGAPSHRIDYGQRVTDWVEQYTSTSKRPSIDAAHWERRLAVLAAKHHVPGAALGILRLRPDRPDELAEAACGTLNASAGIEATTDSLFQIGSISKVWTATIVMQLVDEGLLDLDAPIAEILPELRLADPDTGKTVTMRHLLTHTSGIDGDVFTDTGRGDDCLEKYVALLGDVRQNHPLGATWSYSNSGYVVAGRVIEKLTGKTWDVALRERIVAPLGLRHTVTLAEEALLFRTATGHVVGVAGERSLVRAWGLPRSIGPAGLICSTPADVLAFARLHLTGGLGPDGTRLLSAASAAAMTAQQVELPDRYALGDSWGIGWIRFGWNGRRLIGHDGNTMGQSAFLRVLPGEGLAVTLLTNADNACDLYQELYREIFAELAGVDMPARIEPPDVPADTDITPHLGVYERAGSRLEVLPGDDGPLLRMTVIGPLTGLVSEPVSEYPMTPVDADLYLVREPGVQTWTPVAFYQLRTGERYVHFGGRATPKVG
jgi:dipeptidyl aminopeptidase/acylaminoacyl peptidase/CubicO group peptidase (beta-lactamase class C family)